MLKWDHFRIADLRSLLITYGEHRKLSPVSRSLFLAALNEVQSVSMQSRSVILGKRDEFRRQIGASSENNDELLAVQHVGHGCPCRVAW
jgi:hypothetical protein